ncbi:MAG: phosphate ABC transporter substrate-binding protein [Wenzhouxiangellaceae bacterium]|nr:phosphate ABC transporter substrate-binding protein [Wenzhouxiangellaceae bacterium]
MNRLFQTTIAGLGLMGLVGLGHAEDRQLTITGSSTVAPLVMEMAKRFEQRHADVRIDVQTGGSTRGLIDARRGTADIGMMSRALTEKEADMVGHTLALDGVTLIVHRDNPLEDIDKAQVRAIYRGEIQNWSALGGPDQPITVVHKAEGRSTLEVFLAHFELKNSEVQPDAIIGDNQQGLKTVAGNRYSIAYVSIGAAVYERNRGAAIKPLSLSGVAPEVARVRTGEFPLSRPLNLVTAEPPQGLAREFIEFARSAEVHDLIEAQFFVPFGD